MQNQDSQIEQVQKELDRQNFNLETSLRWKAALKLQKGNPARLLKSINPNEAQLLETASNVHLRFRLGGQNFPPNIYYKIYLNGGQCDVNSFAPRDYSHIQRPDNPHSHKKISYEQYKQNKSLHNSEGWYLRVDNNGWRPNKLRWLQNMYKNARKDEEENGGQQQQQNQNEEEDEEYQQEMRDYMEIPKDYNPLKDDKFVELEEDDFDNEVKELIEWSHNLDYDSYAKDWFQLSTSNTSSNFVTQPVNTNVTLSSIQLQNNIKNYQKNNNINNTNNNISNSNILQQTGNNIINNSNVMLEQQQQQQMA